MRRSSTLFLQAVVVLAGLGALAVMLWEPHVEGRNAHATLFEIYFKDPFLAYVYASSSAFFIALYQVFRVLGYVGQNKTFSQASVDALRTIKYCGMALIGLVAVGMVFMLIFGDKEDRPAGIFMSVMISLIFMVVTTAAAMFQRILKNAVDLKSENVLKVQANQHGPHQQL